MKVPLPSDVTGGPLLPIPCDRRGRSGRAPFAYHMCKFLLLRPWRWFFRSRVFGAEHLPGSGPILLALNHASYLDPWFVGALVPFRTFRFLITETWYERGPAWRFLFRGAGVIPVAEGRPRETVRRVVEALRSGAAVCVFPEGRISADGRMQRGRSGIGYMAAASGVPVTPCYLRGNYEALPRHRKVPRRHPVHLHVAPPVPFPGSVTDRPEARDVVEYVARVMASIGRFEDRLGPYPARVAPHAPADR